ncbi:hypothetical protein [Lentibacillus sp. CBA3610]|nr:hypothetical protein [Lentibacillus sp. CBA3610]
MKSYFKNFLTGKRHFFGIRFDCRGEKGYGRADEKSERIKEMRKTRFRNP